MSQFGVLVNRLFTRKTVLNLIDSGNNDSYQALVDLMNISHEETNENTINSIYSKAYSSYRNEYIFKNTLLNKILLGKHSVQTSTALRELPVGNSVLDFLIVNGIGHAYEIKTGLDNLERLRGQVMDYYEAFQHVTIVTDESHVNGIASELNDFPVGILVLTKRKTLHTVQKSSAYSTRLNHRAIFNILRKSEYEAIIKKYCHALPAVDRAHYYSACFNLFQELNIATCHIEMLQSLKDRSNIQTCFQEFSKVPEALKEIAYFGNFKDKEYSELSSFLGKQIM